MTAPLAEGKRPGGDLVFRRLMFLNDGMSYGYLKGNAVSLSSPRNNSQITGV